MESLKGKSIIAQNRVAETWRYKKSVSLAYGKNLQAMFMKLQNGVELDCSISLREAESKIQDLHISYP